MSLPILQHHHEASPQDLLRLFHKAEGQWAGHLAESQLLEVGTAYANRALSGVDDANNIREVALPQGMQGADAVRLVDAHYREAGTRCAYWVMNASTPEAQNRPLIEQLLARGCVAQAADVMVLRHLASVDVDQGPELKIIPARASFRHVRELVAEWARGSNEPQLSEAAALHLDDPNWDALLAMEGGRAIAYAGVLTVGEVGWIGQVVVADSCSGGAGLGKVMVGRILEICHRAALRHIMLSVGPDDIAGHRLYAGFGFERIGQVIRYAQKP